MAREWGYWTRNKLAILADYLPAFNTAAKRAPHRVFLDLMAGQPENVLKDTGERFDGSARIAMSADPGFTQLRFCEMEPRNAEALERDLLVRFPNDRRWKVIQGDCNEEIDGMLADLKPYRRAPVFAFLDQQGAEIRWETMEKVSRFRLGGKKSEMWILLSPPMIVRGATIPEFATRVDAMFGNPNWRRIQLAKDESVLTPDQARSEMVNLFRWQLRHDLGYQLAASIPMHMKHGQEIYEMVFATDHPIGKKIMTHLYQKASEREPQLMAEARAASINRKTRESSQPSLFDVERGDLAAAKIDAWDDSEPWNPKQSDWWQFPLTPPG